MPRGQVEIPFCVSGPGFAPDLEFIASSAGITPAETLARFCAGDYHVEFMGFAPGFGYLGGLDPALHVPRLDAPRPRIEPGSVAVAGPRAGVYPLATPGGWRILGRTPLTMFDALRDEPSLLTPDARVTFRLIDLSEFEQLRASEDGAIARRSQATSAVNGPAWARVRFAGQLTTIQDLGRFGHEAIGVSCSGAADLRSHAAGQALVGNAPHAASLEMTLVGAQLEILAPVIVALTGAYVAATVEQRSGRLVELPIGQALSLEPGEVLRMHAIGAAEAPRGMRTYLSVRGGIGAARVLGSRSTHLASRLGPAPLRAGDTLHMAHDHTNTGPSAPLPQTERDARAGAVALATLRVTPGPHADGRALAAMDRARFLVDPRSDRVGVRLDGDELPGGTGSMLSVPTRRGDIQLPPSGRPIILSADAPTTGGYPILARVIDADLPAVGQLRPGEEIRLALVPEQHR
ncbi:MAG: carboxyltransferase domain-containing protein [Planctomycetota bacterium]|nr:carboxyltransferase domain-containing protein [Planctomycetota bacterium]